MSDARYTALASALDTLVAHMQCDGLWSNQSPSEQALASTVPFCVDTLAFDQWLQYIMVPTFQGFIQHKQALPSHCDIHSMAQHQWQSQHQTVQACIKAIDDIVSLAKHDQQKIDE